jgi:predicted S18 family serine protease
MIKGVTTALIAILMLAACMPAALAVASTGHIKLLAVYQEGDNFKGSPADVQLEIKKGSGRVFLETIPLSKVDTQISTRFAKEMACKFADMDCSGYDFFYTIKSPAGIVGGPSAGGAISALTVAMLKDLEVDQESAMTGTINSGELIGPVGSLKEKISAAKEAGIKKVIVPAVQEEQNEDNTSIEEYASEIGVQIVGASTLGDAVSELTGKEFAQEDRDITVPESYRDVMMNVAQGLCERSDTLISEFDVFDLKDKKEIVFEWVKLQEEVQNLTEKGDAAFERGDYYSAASYCFGANVKARTLIYSIKKMTDEERLAEAEMLKQEIDTFDKATEKRDKETITDLQTYMIVKERVLEAKQELTTGGNDSASFGYVNERLNSAVAWSEFFGKGGERYNLDEESLKKSCQEIVGEVDERFQYLNLFFPGLLNDLRNNLLMAHKNYEDGEYALCIYLASRTRAEANILVTMMGVKDEVVDGVLDLKVKAAKNAVSKQIDKGTFPIIAYSYYEYSTSLQEENNYAALLYAEYALELSDLDIYFEKKTKGFGTALTRETLKEYLPTVIFIWGLLLGYLLCWIIIRERRKTGTSTAKNNRKPFFPKKRTKTRIRLQ